MATNRPYSHGVFLSHSIYITSIRVEDNSHRPPDPAHRGGAMASLRRAQLRPDPMELGVLSNSKPHLNNARDPKPRESLGRILGRSFVLTGIYADTRAGE